MKNCVHFFTKCWKLKNPDQFIINYLYTLRTILGLSRLNITSGSRTYRIPSPTRPVITRNSFQPSPSPPPQAPSASVESPAMAEISSLDNDPTNQKGFYISFDNDQPKRPKPPLRTKRASPKKERSYVESPEEANERKMVCECYYIKCVTLKLLK